MSSISDLKKEIFRDLKLNDEFKEDNKEDKVINTKIENKISDEVKNKGEINIDELNSFSENPFNLYKEEELEELAESIKDDGLLTPIILWKKENNYIILSGHNRVEALKLLGYKKLTSEMYQIKENITLDDARLILIDANLVQRKSLLPSEKAKAYKIQMQVLKDKQCKRYKNFIFDNVTNVDKKCTEYNLEIKRNVYIYLRLNNLISELLNKVDNEEISIRMGMELSYLKEEEQKNVFKYFFVDNKAKINIDICKEIRERGRKVDITDEIISLIVDVLTNEKPYHILKLSLKEIRELSDKPFITDKEAKEYIRECIKFYEKNKYII